MNRIGAKRGLAERLQAGFTYADLLSLKTITIIGRHE
jgi:hypothetical protein